MCAGCRNYHIAADGGGDAGKNSGSEEGALSHRRNIGFDGKDRKGVGCSFNIYIGDRLVFRTVVVSGTKAVEVVKSVDRR
jgi:hypothetical protein